MPIFIECTPTIHPPNATRRLPLLKAGHTIETPLSWHLFPIPNKAKTFLLKKTKSGGSTHEPPLFCYFSFISYLNMFSNYFANKQRLPLLAPAKSRAFPPTPHEPPTFLLHLFSYHGTVTDYHLNQYAIKQRLPLLAPSGFPENWKKPLHS